MSRTVGSEGQSVKPSEPGRARHTGRWLLRTNTVSFYLRSLLVLDGETLHATVPRTILGLVPIGTRSFAAPVDRLADLRIGIVLHADRILAALVCLGVAVLLRLPWLAAAGLLVLGGLLLLLGLTLGLRIRDLDGRWPTVPICVLQRRVAGAAVRQIERAMAAGRRS